MRNLVRISAKVRGGGYDGAVIIKSVWKLEDKNAFAIGKHDISLSDAEIPEPEIVKENKRMLLCLAMFEGESLLTTMFKTPALPELDAPETIAGYAAFRVEDGKCWRRFTREDVLEYVDAVRDPNPIHRCEIPIVPGMCLMEAIKNSLPSETTELSLAFRNTVFAGEELILDAANGEVCLKGREVFITGTYK